MLILEKQRFYIESAHQSSSELNWKCKIASMSLLPKWRSSTLIVLKTINATQHESAFTFYNNWSTYRTHLLLCIVLNMASWPNMSTHIIIVGNIVFVWLCKAKPCIEFRKNKYIFTFSIISQHSDGTCDNSWRPPPPPPPLYPRKSPAMVLTKLSQIIPVCGTKIVNAYCVKWYFILFTNIVNLSKGIPYLNNNLTVHA